MYDGYDGDSVVMSSELQEHFAWLNRIEQDIYEAKNEYVYPVLVKIKSIIGHVANSVHTVIGESIND